MERIPQSAPDFDQDRRRVDRAIRTFRAACIEIDGKAFTVTMKDFSRHGCGFDGKVPISRGDTVRYRWGNRPFVVANVMWVDGTRFGLENERPYDPGSERGFPYRAVRIPFEQEAAIYIAGRSIEGSAINIAQKGLCVSVTERVPPGNLSTIEIGGKVFENTTLRWTKGAQAGFALNKPMSIPDLAKFTNDA
ncbi:MAG: PilZ domain-containing protein [Pseudomonadota bacterium]|jgi:hypothetical protein|uniref:PilZ domain-containing protein n=1 Tax=Qipengyuania flava TaxID=192812 RepID=A0A3T1CL70_9SPHN|nr:PilZ domain-containing protein [Qipengyuania flava]KZX87932.1 hypothetical protein A3719_09090 [Erythrobacter sp. HI0020]KZY18118.1 hypothetical protein A3726_09540 [Erythrobacter sp. HI0037]KZY18364.1 hypothetical protein A3727_03815 [Erythrobacter sp. HI0038]MEC7421938.1 PilZ domain-containing protein [Pseudomonadota bacterium]OAN82843.1 hypothetical protein A8B77_14005 [Erythrobacter sp. EhN03]HCS18418.1 hypothetical protein [Erythrobacter sp.]|tara:strand:- start:104 stop:679 length:576 start_codon:yes stop_codon:yes gene_type:complete